MAAQRSWSEIISDLTHKPMLVALGMGISSGWPLLLGGKTLSAWLTEDHIDIKTIGLFALAGLPYTLKFLWAPLLDRFSIPIYGRRRGWMLLSQLGVIGALTAMAFRGFVPDIQFTALMAVVLSFFSASQDIAVDAYRRESLKDSQLGFGSSFYIYGYRISMWITGGLSLILADIIPWEFVYILAAAMMALFILITLWADEPKIIEKPRTLSEAVIGPLVEYFRRDGALMILAFILLYKVGDTMAGQLTTPFYLMIGFTKTNIGTIAKTLGLFSTLLGAFLGGLFVARIGIRRALWFFGFLQAASTLSFAGLDWLGPQLWALTLVVFFEDVSGGMGTAAFAAFMASQTNKKFTATQYALLSSMMGVPRVLIASPTGYIQDWLGWSGFFIVCTLVAIPGMFLLTRLPKESSQNGGS